MHSFAPCLAPAPPFDPPLAQRREKDQLSKRATQLEAKLQQVGVCTLSAALDALANTTLLSMVLASLTCLWSHPCLKTGLHLGLTIWSLTVATRSKKRRQRQRQRLVHRAGGQLSGPVRQWAWACRRARCPHWLLRTAWQTSCMASLACKHW